MSSEMQTAQNKNLSTRTKLNYRVQKLNKLIRPHESPTRTMVFQELFLRKHLLWKSILVIVISIPTFSTLFFNAVPELNLTNLYIVCLGCFVFSSVIIGERAPQDWLMMRILPPPPKVVAKVRMMFIFITCGVIFCIAYLSQLIVLKNPSPWLYLAMLITMTTFWCQSKGIDQELALTIYLVGGGCIPALFKWSPEAVQTALVTPWPPLLTACYFIGFSFWLWKTTRSWNH